MLEICYRVVVTRSRDQEADHEVVRCPNHFKVKEKCTEEEEIRADLFRIAPEDNMLSMLQDN